MGYILLAGGAEFGGQMAEPDRQAIELAGGSAAKISIIPTAAAPDNNHQRAGQNGVHWFESLGATDVTSLPLIDHSSANSVAIAKTLRESGFIYLLGGFPGYLGQILQNSHAWQAMLQAYRAGAVIGGSSAGAMVLCSHYYSPSAREVVPGLGLVPNSCVLPHHNTFGREWAANLQESLPHVTLLGIDEQTGMLNDGPQNRWQVYGGGAVTVYRRGQISRYETGSIFK